MKRNGKVEKPAALKTDENGNCIAICRTGQLEFIHKMIAEDGLPQAEACQNFIDAVKAHVNVGDPIIDGLTVEKVRSQFRRDSGKLKDKRKSLVGPTKEEEDKILAMAAEIQEKRAKEAKDSAVHASVEKLAQVFLESDNFIPDSCLVCGIDEQHCEIRKAIVDILDSGETEDGNP